MVKNLATSRQNKGDITEDSVSVFPKLDELTLNSVPELTEQIREQITSVATLENFNTFADSNFLPQKLQSTPILLAAPENFNPALRVTPKPISPPPQKLPPTTNKPEQPPLVLESIQTGFRSELSNSEQQNQIIEPVFQFRLLNGQKIRLKTGLNTFNQPGFESITNIPFQVGWEGKTGKYTIQANAGIDVFNRLPTALNFNAQIDRQIFVNFTPTYQLKSGLFLSALVEQSPYKFNAKTLENQITALRSGLNVYWQIDPNTSFFSLYRIGLYNDDNFEQQSFSRLEHKWGKFWLAANLFTWKYANDRQDMSGYFSPHDFLVYNGEIGWGGDIFSFLNCRLNTTLGQQQLNGKTTGVNSYQTRCTAKISPNIDLDLGYGFSNVRNLDTGDSSYNNKTFTGQLQVKF
ncbi:hypothetical protein [Anabaena lutea]|uniref:Uncharacterized protein n=1 Tax=Anabaena lutea FACHB-196 TaxID=2692881 RepID=A0ABR8FCA0_9NOST|nr:hypothetical protein [Anabaena lutea]MBD2566500.1 hypothetical protein [Anabaena lutea FACHB-196]